MRRTWIVLVAAVLSFGAVREAGSWMITPLDSAGSSISNPSFTMGDAGRLAVAHFSNGGYMEQDLLRYGFCDDECYRAVNWSIVNVEILPNGSQYDQTCSVKLNGSGNPRIAYYEREYEDLKYATCDGGCDDPGNWQKVFVDTEGDVGQYPALILNDLGNPRIAYYDNDDPDTRLAYCDGACYDPASWESVVIDPLGGYGRINMAVLPGGGLSAVYRTRVGDRLRYLECSADCTDPGNWTAVSVDTLGDVARYLSLGVDSSGNPRVLYKELAEDKLNLALCDGDCTAPANWSSLTIDTEPGSSDDSDHQIALTPGDGARAVYRKRDEATGRSEIWYASCESDCSNPVQWSSPEGILQDQQYSSTIETLRMRLEDDDRPVIVFRNEHYDLVVVNDCTDEDGDRNSPDMECGATDCDDDPSDDPPGCDACECGTTGCTICARCKNPWSSDFPGDGVDSNCDGDDCFIATAAFGSRLEPEIQALRHFRDKILTKTRPGRLLVDYYYHYSPPAAAYIREHPVLRSMVRAALFPVIGVARLLLTVS